MINCSLYVSKFSIVTVKGTTRSEKTTEENRTTKQLIPLFMIEHINHFGKETAYEEDERILYQ